ncbi:MAG: hypothetical protein V7709_18125 [Halioglobus sp.]
MSHSPLEKLESGVLWDEFCDQLKAAGSQVLAPAVPGDIHTRAEGFRYLTRLLRLALEKNIEFSNPQFPQFYSLSHETAKIGNDNPDNYYQNCAVDGSRDYLVRGNRGSVAYLSIESKAGSFAGGGDMAPTGHIELDGLTLDAHGDFELLVSATRTVGNWLPMTSETDNLLVRQTFRDRAAEHPAQLSIECLNPLGGAELEPALFAQQLLQVVPFITGTAGLFRGWMNLFSSHVNQLPPNDQAMCLRAGGDPSIHYHNSYWRLGPNEALLIEFMPPKSCRTWNFQLSNYWMESLDYRHHRISVSNYSAHTEADGLVRIVVAHSDPGPKYRNWLTSAGHELGAMLLRYVEASDFPPISTQVIVFNDLLSGSNGDSCERI